MVNYSVQQKYYQVFNSERQTLRSLDNLEKNSVDFYASVRSLYAQDRENKIKNTQRGNIEVIFDDKKIGKK